MKMPAIRRCKICRGEGHNVSNCLSAVVTTIPNTADIAEETGSSWVELNIDSETIDKFKIILEICNEVASTLKKGFAECVYESAICVELQKRNIEYSSQETIPICYKGHYIGNNRLDIILNSWLPLIIEVKATSNISTEDRWQAIRYMTRKKVPYGVVVNFSQTIKGPLYLSFLVKQGETYYQFNLDENKAKAMIDY